MVGRFPRFLAACVLTVAVPAAAAAQERSPLLVPTIAASAAAAADWGSTYYALANFRLREVNPVLSPLQRRPGRMISVGAALDAGLVSAWNVGMGRRHERIAIAGLWAMTAFRAYLAVHNLRNTRRAERRPRAVPPAMATTAGPASPGASMTCATPAIGPACVAAVRTAR